MILLHHNIKQRQEQLIKDIKVNNPVKDCKIVKVKPDNMAELMRMEMEIVKKEKRNNILINILALIFGAIVLLCIFAL